MEDHQSRHCNIRRAVLATSVADYTVAPTDLYTSHWDCPRLVHSQLFLPGLHFLKVSAISFLITGNFFRMLTTLYIFYEQTAIGRNLTGRVLIQCILLAKCQYIVSMMAMLPGFLPPSSTKSMSSIEKKKNPLCYHIYSHWNIHAS